jgi:DTW domain-containing protein YfiP
LRGVEFEEGVIERALEGQDAYLLYPGETSTPCENVKLGPDSTVIVVDGTWDEAGKIVYRNSCLKSLPRLTFSQPIRSQYKIRKQPRDNYLSTIESVSYLLKFNASANGLHPMCDLYDRQLVGFNKMVDSQLQYFPRMAGGNGTASFF